MNILSDLISPKVKILLAVQTLTRVKNGIQKKLNFTFDRYTLHYAGQGDAISFDIYVDGKKRNYPYTDGLPLIKTIKQLLLKYLKSDEQIDFASIHYDDQGNDVVKLSGKIYTTKNGVKECTEFKLN